MKKVLCFPTASASTAVGAKPAAFFELCGSPIRTDVQLGYDDNEPPMPATPMTPPLGSRYQPRTQGASRRHALLSPGDEDESKEENGEPGAAATTIAATRGDDDAARLDGDTDVQDEHETKQISPLRLANAQEAGIPCFMEPWYESKTDLPSATAAAGVRSPSHVSISMSELQLGRVLGEGAFGRVYMGRWKGKKVAVKVLIRQNLSDEVVREFETEVKIMSYLNHPNICALLGACLEPTRRALVVELMERGCLWNVLRSYRRDLSPKMRSNMVLDIARGMDYLHHFERPILHRDMKSPNLLVEKDFTIKISDFGLSRVKAQIQTMTGNCGTVQWMAPEVLGNRKYTEKADVFSFGIVVWEIFTGRCPYDGMTQIQAALSVLNHDLRPTVPTSCPTFFARLMKMCWAREPEMRPSFDFIVRLCEQNARPREPVVVTPKIEAKPRRVWKP